MTRSPGRLRVVFLCTANSCRSQMAEGWARQLKADCIDAFSAGLKPGVLNPKAVAVMAEAGVDISGQIPKTLAELGPADYDFVVAVCAQAHESCPIFPGHARLLRVPFDDPPLLEWHAAGAEEALGHYRRVRDEIRAFVESLPEALPRA